MGRGHQSPLARASKHLIGIPPRLEGQLDFAPARLPGNEEPEHEMKMSLKMVNEILLYLAVAIFASPVIFALFLN